MKKGNGIQHEIFIKKAIFTGIIILVYLIGRSLPLFGMDVSVEKIEDIDVQLLLMQSINGDRYQNSIFTLGVFPYMIASLVMQIVVASLSADKKSRVSQVSLNRISLYVMLIVAVIQAIYKMRNLTFIYTDNYLIIAKIVVVIQMVAGAFVILWMSDRNSKYGIGGQTTLIYINILDSLTSAIQGNPFIKTILPIAISIVIMIVVITMENAEKRIPVQRVSIHSIYADKNYLAIKLNPIGVMPVMFSSAVFMLLQIFISFLKALLPENGVMTWINDNMVLSSIFGIIVYIGVLYFLTISMALVFISPKDLTEQFLKSGDSVVNLHAGRDTRRYLRKQVLIISIISSTIMGICILIPMLLEHFDLISGTLAILPSSFMLLSGIFYNLYQEVITIRNYDEYKPFI
ncbi:MAG TPA: preprotein translocase subunit SecY [Lachnospiraceae bacterium]|nr:preprotein translocase subunit SecY [Lachnospiraceae bacterium]